MKKPSTFYIQDLTKVSIEDTGLTHSSLTPSHWHQVNVCMEAFASFAVATSEEGSSKYTKNKKNKTELEGKNRVHNDEKVILKHL